MILYIRDNEITGLNKEKNILPGTFNEVII